MFGTVTADRWNDSGELRSTVLHGEVGWLSLTGLSVAALVTNRNMRVTYTSTALNQTRQREIEFKGTGWGGDVSYFGMNWTTGARFLAYGYGHSVDRVRTVLESGNVDRFPRLQRLIGSVITRAAGALDREASLTVGRQFEKSSVTVDVQWTRDALTQEKTQSAGITVGLWPSARFGINLSAGASNSNEAGTIAWAGLAFTLRRAR
jgi:hypothetical protein